MQNLSETKNSYESAILENLGKEVAKREEELASLKASHDHLVSNAPYSVRLSDDGKMEVSVYENGEFSRVETLDSMDETDKFLDSLDQAKKKSVSKSETKIKSFEHDLELLKSVLENKDFSFSLSFSRGDMVADFASSDFARTKLLNSLAPELLKTQSDGTDDFSMERSEGTVIAEPSQVSVERTTEADALDFSEFSETPDSEVAVSAESDAEASEMPNSFSDFGFGDSVVTESSESDTDVETETLAVAEPAGTDGFEDLFGVSDDSSKAESETEAEAIPHEPDSMVENVSGASGESLSDFFHSTESEETPKTSDGNENTQKPAETSESFDDLDDLLFGGNGAIADAEPEIVTEDAVTTISTTEPSDSENASETEEDPLAFFGSDTETPDETGVSETVAEVSESSVEESEDDPLAFFGNSGEDSSVVRASDSETEGVDDTASEVDEDPLAFFGSSEETAEVSSEKTSDEVAVSGDPLDFFEVNESEVTPAVEDDGLEHVVEPAVAQKKMGESINGKVRRKLFGGPTPTPAEPTEDEGNEITGTIDADPTEEIDVLAELEAVAKTDETFVRTEVSRPEIQGKSKEEIENERIASEFLKHVKSITVKFPPNIEFTVRKEGYLDKLSNREKILTVVAGVSFTTAIIALIFASYAVDGNKFDQSVLEAQFNQKISDLTAQVKSLEEEKEELISVKKANEEKEAPIVGSAKNLTINSIEKIKIDEESDPKMTTSVIKNKYLVVKLPSLKPEAGKKLSIVLKSGETIDYVIKRAISGSNDGILKIIENQEKELSSKPESQRYFILVGTDTKQYYIAQP